MSEKIKLGWAEVQQRAAAVAGMILACPGSDRPLAVYGVPNGGLHAAQAVVGECSHQGWYVTPILEEASVIVDDIIDSGATRDRHAALTSAPFFALVDKRGRDRDLMGKWVEFWWEAARREDGPQDAVRRLIQYIDPDPEREGLKDTPDRVVRSYAELFAGYRADVPSLFKTFDVPHDEMIVLKNVTIHSHCEHHLLPFVGEAHIAYVPDGRVIGLSKLARVVDAFARRLQVQERLTCQVTQALDEHLKPLGSACVIEARHHCVCGRGVSKQDSVMVTSSLTGVFREPAVRAEFFGLVRGR